MENTLIDMKVRLPAQELQNAFACYMDELKEEISEAMKFILTANTLQQKIVAGVDQALNSEIRKAIQNYYTHGKGGELIKKAVENELRRLELYKYQSFRQGWKDRIRSAWQILRHGAWG